jgi:membrane protease YdiL (CAAX protease family)
MSWVRGGSRVAGDFGFIGSVVGFIVSVILFAVMIGLSIRLDRHDKAGSCTGCACLLRLVALLVLTLGMGLGYMIGRSMSG